MLKPGEWGPYKKCPLYDGLDSNLGPQSVCFFGDGLIGFVNEPQNSDGLFAWSVRDEKKPDGDRYTRGVSPTSKEAQAAAKKEADEVLLLRASAG